MNMKISVLTMLTLLLSCFQTFSPTIKIVEARPGIIKVPEDYPKIQWAVGNASAGDTILVAARTYYEHISIDKPLNLIAENMAATIIDGGGDGNVIETWSDNVTLKGFTIQNGAQGILIEDSSFANISGNLIKNTTYAAIRINDYSTHNIISNNIIKENDFIGIYVFWYSENNTVSHNCFLDNEIGIELGVSSGNIISNNIIRNSVWEGILLFGDCDYNKVYNNSVLLNSYGVKLEGQGPTPEYQPNRNLVYHNTVSNNDVNIVVSQSFNNTIYKNNFIKKPYFNQVSSESSNNKWDNGVEGNFWSDYGGVDEDGNGIGDTPYIIDENNTDSYPLMFPAVWNYSSPIPVLWEGTVYPVAVSSNSTISAFKFDKSQFQISFNVEGPIGTTGFCNVTIPKSLLKGNPWTITVDGQPPINIEQNENATHSFLYFTYTHASTLHVVIQGTWAIPEFPSSTIILMLVFLTALSLILAKRKAKNGIAK